RRRIRPRTTVPGANRSQTQASTPAASPTYRAGQGLVKGRSAVGGGSWPIAGSPRRDGWIDERGAPFRGWETPGKLQLSVPTDKDTRCGRVSYGEHKKNPVWTDRAHGSGGERGLDQSLRAVRVAASFGVCRSCRPRGTVVAMWGLSKVVE